MNLRRKRLRLMRDTQWRGYTRTAEGNPITLSQVRSVVALSVLGNSSQSGTPSPDNPVDVVGTGTRTGNLLSMIDVSANNIPVKSYNNGIIEVIGNSNYSGGRTTRLSEYITLEANQTYTLALYLVSGQVDSNINACLSRRENDNFYHGGTFSVAKRVIRITPDENVEVYLGLNLSQGDYNSTLRVAIYKGSYTAENMPQYEPYGYKVAVTASGRNLFDISQVGDTNTLYNDGRKLKVTEYSNSTNLSVEKFLAMTGLKPGDVFTAARQYEVINGIANSVTGSIRFNRRDSSGRFYIIPGNKDVAINVVPDDFNSDIYSAINFYGVNSGNLKEVVFSEIQILKGSYTADTLPAYEPYGYKVAVTAQGRNLWDRDFSDNDDNWVGTKDGYRYLNFDLKPNTKYTLFVKQNNMHKGYSDYWDKKQIAFYLGEIANNWSGNVVFGNTTTNRAIKTLYSFETTDVPYYFNLYISQGSMVTVKEVFDELLPGIMLVEGKYTSENMPPYEPYKEPQSFNVYTSEQLHGVGDAHDTVILDFDKHKAELVQQYEYFKVDTAQWYGETTDRYNGINTTNRFHIMNLYSGNYPANDSKCNILQKYNEDLWAKDMQGFTWNNDQLHLRINNDVLGVTANDTAKERTSKFVEYIQSNDIYVLGKLISPVVRDITALQNWDSLPQLRGTWILTATGGTEPTLKAAYTSNTNPYPDYSNIVSVLPIYPDLDITGDDPTAEGVNTEETEDQQETTSTDEPTSETNNSIDILDLYE